MSTKFHSLKVQDIRKETADTVSIAFSLPVGLLPEFKFKPGQYLTLRTNIGGQDVRRSYSICASPSEKELRVAVKAIENGLFSNFATKNLKVGDMLDVMPPMGSFMINPEPFNQKNYVFFAAGSGITPVISMIKSILILEKKSTVYLFYSNKQESDVIFKNDLSQLAAANQNFKLTFIYTRQNGENELATGRVDKAKCEAIFSGPLSGISIDGIYSCGPQEMIMTVKDYFLSKGIPAAKIHFELFSATAAEPVAETKPAENVEASVTVIMDDESFEFKLNTAGKSVLQAAQDAGADVPFSCKGGVCCTCKAKVMKGTAKMDLNYALEPDEVEEGFILTCQAHPTSENVVISFDEY